MRKDTMIEMLRVIESATGKDQSDCGDVDHSDMTVKELEENLVEQIRALPEFMAVLDNHYKTCLKSLEAIVDDLKKQMDTGTDTTDVESGDYSGLMYDSLNNSCRHMVDHLGIKPHNVVTPQWEYLQCNEMPGQFNVWFEKSYYNKNRGEQGAWLARLCEFAKKRGIEAEFGRDCLMIYK